MHAHMVGPMYISLKADLDKKAAVIELARDHVHMAVAKKNAEALRAAPRHLHRVLQACTNPHGMRTVDESRHAQRVKESYWQVVMVTRFGLVTSLTAACQCV